MMLNLLVIFPKSGMGYPMEFNTSMNVADVCQDIRSKIAEAAEDTSKEFGLFVTDHNPKHGFWMDDSAIISYYNLLPNTTVEFRSFQRLLSVKLMDGTKKVLQVDERKTIGELLIPICLKMGINNYTEYSLIRELSDVEKSRTLTLRRKNATIRHQFKMDKMRQKLHTDEELNWLSHGKTLTQENVSIDDVLLLRRKYFFSDKNVGIRDPLQLSLLYIQLKEAVINGTHLIKQDQAVKLAALQCQIEMGTWNTDRNKLFKLDLKKYLPSEYVKTKGIDKRILEQYKNLRNIAENEAKLRYSQFCQSLPTYGITFFLIKEKMKGKEKLVPALLGISKNSVVRADVNTKEILEEWPISTILRWGNQTNCFTLDFGEHREGKIYAVQTTEGERIRDILTGYIDITLKRQREAAHLRNNGDEEENTIIEDRIEPSRADVISNMTNTLPSGGRFQETDLSRTGVIRTASPTTEFSEGRIAESGQAVVQRTYLGGCTQVSHDLAANGSDRSGGFELINLSQSKRALVSRVDFGLRTIHEASADLEMPIYSDEAAFSGDDADTCRWRWEALDQARAGILSHLGAMTIATGNLITSTRASSHQVEDPSETSAETIDYVGMDASLVSIGINVNGLMQCIRMYNQVDAADGNATWKHLRLAAQGLSDAFLSLMQAANLNASNLTSDPSDGPTGGGGGGVVDRAALLEAASRVGDASKQLLELIASSPSGSVAVATEGPAASPTAAVVDWESRDKFLSATKTVANRTASLVRLSKTGAVALANEADALIAAAAAMGDQTDAAKAAAKLLQATQTSLVQAATEAGRATSRLVACAKVIVCTMEQPESQQQLIQLAKEVGQAADAINNLDQLIRASQNGQSSCWSLEDHEAHLMLEGRLHDGVLALHHSLDALVDCLRVTTIQAHQDPVVNTLFTVAVQMPSSLGDATKVIAMTSSLASAAHQLIADLRFEANEMQTNSLSLSGLSVDDATGRASILQAAVDRLLSAQDCVIASPQSVEHQKAVLECAKVLVETSRTAAAPIIRARLTRGLEFATRLTAFNVGTLVTIGGEVIRVCEGNTYELAMGIDKLQKHVMPQVNISCMKARVEPYSTKNQTNLLAASQDLMQCLEDLLRSADAVVPTISDAGIQTAFSGATRNTQACLTGLRVCYADSEPTLAFAPLAFSPPDQTLVPKAQDTHGLLALSACRSMVEKVMQELNEQLRIDVSRRMLLPDETLDSISAALWAAVSWFNRSFAGRSLEDHSDEQAEETHKLSPFVSRIIPLPSNRDPNVVVTVINDLMDHLKPLTRGISGLVAFLETVANAKTVDPGLARVLLTSHGLADKRQSGYSGRVTPVDCSGSDVAMLPSSPGLTAGSGHEQQQAQSTAAAMLRHLISIGDSCLTDASQLIAWALTETNYETVNQAVMEEAELIAEQLFTSVNAVLGYVPGEVIVRRLSALLEDATGHLSQESKSQAGRPPTRGSSIASPAPPARQIFSPSHSSVVYEQLAAASQRLAKECTICSHQVASLHTPTTTNNNRPAGRQSTVGTPAIGSDSTVVKLAHIADRLAGTLADVVQAAGGRAGTPIEAVGHLFGQLAAIGEPLVTSLRLTLRGGTDTHTGPRPDEASVSTGLFQLSQLLLQLRDWAIEMNLQAANSAEQQQHWLQYPGGDSTISLGSPGGENEHRLLQEAVAMSQMHAHCEASLRRIATLLHPENGGGQMGAYSNEVEVTSVSSPQSSPVVSSLASSYASPAVGLIRLPVSDQTYAQCYQALVQLSKEMMPQLQAISRAAGACDSTRFIAATKTVTQATCQLINLTHQTAYLIGSAHPASKPGHFGRFVSSSDQLTTLHDHVAAIRRGASELMRADTKPQVFQTATAVAQRASELCKFTRPLLNDCAVPSEKKRLAELLEQVARAAASILSGVRTLQLSSDDALTATSLDQLRRQAGRLEETVDEYSAVLLQYAGGSPSQVADEAFALQAPVLEAAQEIVVIVYRLLGCSRNMLTTSDEADLEKATEEYAHASSSCQTSMARLVQLLQGLVPALKACDTLSYDITNQLLRLEKASVSVVSLLPSQSHEASCRLETSLALMQTSLQQLSRQLCLEAVENWNHGQWELIAHNLKFAASYLPSLVVECTRSAGTLQHTADQAGLFRRTRMVLGACQQFVLQGLKNSIQQCMSLPPGGSEPLSSEAVHQYAASLQQACGDLSDHVEQVAKNQGGLNWHLAAITTAAATLDDVGALKMGDGSWTELTGHTASPTALPVNFVQLHTALGHHLRSFHEDAVSLTKASTANTGSHGEEEQGAAGDLVNACTAIVAQRYEQIVQTSRSVACLLASQAGDRAEAGRAVARRLCKVVQAVGFACVDFLRSPFYASVFNTLNARVEDLKSVLQSYACGAESCTKAALGIGRLVADIDTTALFTRAGITSEASPVSSSTGDHQEVHFLPSAGTADKLKSFVAAQESMERAVHAVVLQLDKLVTGTDHQEEEALSVVSQTCLNSAADLTEAVKVLTSVCGTSAAATATNAAASAASTTRTSCSPSSVSWSDASKASVATMKENQVHLLTAARSLLNEMVTCLNHARSVTTTRYALDAWGGDGQSSVTVSDGETSLQSLLSDHQIALQEAVRQVKTQHVSVLTRVIRAFSDQVHQTLYTGPAHRPVSTGAQNKAEVMPPPKSLKPLSLRKKSSSDVGGRTLRAEHASIRQGLTTTLSEIAGLKRQLEAWSVADGTLHFPAGDHNWQEEADSATGQITRSAELVAAALAITQAVSAANSATTSARLSDMALSGDLVRRAADHLVRCLRPYCQETLAVARADAVGATLIQVESTCRRIMAGAVESMTEIGHLVEYMDKTLEDGPSSNSSMQVTLAMRRLREPVHKIVEGANSMPKAREDDHKPPHSQASSLPPRPSFLLKPKVCSGTLQGRDVSAEEVEQSISLAKATAADQVASGGDLEAALTDMTGQLERNVAIIGRAVKRSTSLRQASQRSEDETVLPTELVRPTPVQTYDLLEASRHVVHTILSLMYWAAAAQRELVQQGRLPPSVELLTNSESSNYENESQWAHGLVSAARHVAAAANHLVKAVPQLISAGPGEKLENVRPELFVSAAQTTAAYTAQLVIACMAKADSTSASCHGLSAAGASVKRATERLARLASALGSPPSPTTADFEASASSSVVSSMRKVIETKSHIASKQKELEDLQKQLKQMNQDRYKMDQV